MRRGRLGTANERKASVPTAHKCLGSNSAASFVFAIDRRCPHVGKIPIEQDDRNANLDALERDRLRQAKRRCRSDHESLELKLHQPSQRLVCAVYMRKKKDLAVVLAKLTAKCIQYERINWIADIRQKEAHRARPLRGQAAGRGIGVIVKSPRRR